MYPTPSFSKLELINRFFFTSSTGPSPWYNRTGFFFSFISVPPSICPYLLLLVLPVPPLVCRFSVIMLPPLHLGDTYVFVFMKNEYLIYSDRLGVALIGVVVAAMSVDLILTIYPPTDAPIFFLFLGFMVVKSLFPLRCRAWSWIPSDQYPSCKSIIIIPIRLISGPSNSWCVVLLINPLLAARWLCADQVGLVMFFETVHQVLITHSGSLCSFTLDWWLTNSDVKSTSTSSSTMVK